MVQFKKHGYMGREGALESHCTCMSMLSRFSHVLFFVTPGTAACQAPLSMGFSRQEHWSGLPCPPPGNLPNPGIESISISLKSPALASEFFTASTTWEARESNRSGFKFYLCHLLLGDLDHVTEFAFPPEGKKEHSDSTLNTMAYASHKIAS